MTEINYSKLPLFRDINPTFSGEPFEINKFILACHDVIGQHQRHQNQNCSH